MKNKKFIAVFITVLILASTLMGTISISASNQNNSYYLFFQGFDWGLTIPLPYETVETITYIDGLEEQLNAPSDLFRTEDGTLYIVDSNNSRIVILSEKGELLNVFGESYGELDEAAVEALMEENLVELESRNLNPEKYSQMKTHLDRVAKSKLIQKLNKPEGVFVDKDGDIFIADTGNNRIVHLAPDGSYVEMFAEPEADVFDYETYPFRPSKLYIDAVNRIYVINYMDYHGFLTLDENGSFLGYVAQSKIKYNFLLNLYKLIYSEDVINRNFARVTPPYFSNFIISKYDSLIYAVARGDKVDQIKKLTPAGNNVYPAGMYGLSAESEENTDEIKYASYIDISVGRSGLVYAADAATNAIDIYDSEGKSIASLGGTGNNRGAFGAISAIELNYDDDTLYVLDSSRNTIQIMKPTMFMKKIIDATELFSDGKYDEALVPWEEVLQMHNSYYPALKGIAKAKFGQQEYAEAMNLYKISWDNDGYSQAFDENRLLTFRANFGLVVFITVALVVGLLYLLSYLRKLAGKVDLVYDYSDDKHGLKIFLHSVLLFIFHPIDAHNKLKANRERYRWWSVALLTVLLVIVKVIYIYIAHYAVTGIIPQFINFTQEIVMMLAPMFGWILVSFAITSISDGKTTFKETCIATLLAFTPVIIFTLPLGLLSNIMSGTEKVLFDSIYSILYMWCFALVLLGLMNLNEYSFKKMVFNAFKILFAALCIVMIVGMVYVIINQFVIFVEEINIELTFLSNR